MPVNVQATPPRALVLCAVSPGLLRHGAGVWGAGRAWETRAACYSDECHLLWGWYNFPGPQGGVLLDAFPTSPASLLEMWAARESAPSPSGGQSVEIEAWRARDLGRTGVRALAGNCILSLDCSEPLCLVQHCRVHGM